jgi:hypothetical protein
MDERQDKRVDLNSELGMSRRDLLRRGAIVGGTLLWVAPAIQSMAPKAFAQVPSPGGGGCAACYCWNTRASGALRHDTALHGGIHAGGLLNAEDCASFCTSTLDETGRAFTNSVYCSGTSNCTGVARDDRDGTLPGTLDCSGTVTRLTGPNSSYGVICCDES